jgi:spore germination protein YaaH
MAYEYRGPFSGPGSVAPFDWVRRVTAFAASQIPANKLLLGLAFYGYDWNTTSGGSFSVGYPRATQIASYYHVAPGFDGVQQSLTFSYTADPGDREPAPVRSPPPSHVITSRTAAPCDVVPPAQPRPTPAPTPAPDTPQTHEVWIEDAGSVAARVSLAFNYGARGVGTWRLGLEDPEVWSVFAQWRATASAR